MVTWQHKLTPIDPTATELYGVVADLRPISENEDGTVFCIGCMSAGERIRGAVEARGQILPGEAYTFLGAWQDHPKYGWQFAWTDVVREIPTDTASLISFLAKHCTGVGPAWATKLVESYGADVVRILTDEPQRIADDGHLTLSQAQAAGESLASIAGGVPLEVHRQLHQLLRGHGFWAKTQKAALRLWKGLAPDVIRRDAFKLLTHGLPGAGFVRCDRLYLACGRPPGRLKRQALAAWHSIAILDGDTWINAATCLEQVRQKIGGAKLRERRALAMLHRAGLISSRMDREGRVWIADRAKAKAERIVAMRLQMLMDEPAEWPAVTRDNPAFASLSNHQFSAVAGALTSPVVVITGGPGTGKTWTAGAVIRALVEFVGAAKIAVCAPTGKAAVRIGEKLAEAALPLQATTIHRMLKVIPTPTGFAFEYGPDNPLPYKYIVIDESSMEDVSLAAAKLSACAPGTHLLILGDVAQLPPIGHGAFLRDVLAAGLPTATLTEIQRNAGAIVHACKSIRQGSAPAVCDDLSQWPHVNLFLLPLAGEGPKEEKDALAERMAQLYRWLGESGSQRRPARKDGSLSGPYDPIDDVQVIAARKASCKTLNALLQKQLNAAGEKGAKGFRVGDKVICTKNGLLPTIDQNHGKTRNEYVANGDIGRVLGFRGQQMLVKLSQPPRLVAVPMGKQAEEAQAASLEDEDAEGQSALKWELAYAITGHKMQGSESPVMIELLEKCGKLGSREWALTALSRARELCICLGDQRTLKAMIRNVILPDRKTFLQQLLKGEMAL